MKYVSTNELEFFDCYSVHDRHVVAAEANWQGRNFILRTNGIIVMARNTQNTQGKDVRAGDATFIFENARIESIILDGHGMPYLSKDDREEPVWVEAQPAPPEHYDDLISIIYNTRMIYMKQLTNEEPEDNRMYIGLWFETNPRYVVTLSFEEVSVFWDEFLEDAWPEPWDWKDFE